MIAQVVASDLLSAHPKILARNRQRRALGITHQALAAGAGISERGWYALLRGDYHPTEGTIRKLDAYLARARLNAGSTTLAFPLTAATYGGFFAAACAELEVSPGAARALLRAGKTCSASATWARASDAREIAIYLTNTALDVKQRRLADVTGLTPAAICIALKRVEDRREETEFDALVERIEQAVMGRE